MDEKTERTYPPVGGLLRTAWKQVQDEVYAGLHAAGFDDLRPSHRLIMGSPPVDGLRPSQIAARNLLSKQAANDVLRDLEKLGYLRLEPDPADGRARIVRFTERGWRFFRTGRQISTGVSERWATAIGTDRFDTLVEALRAFVALSNPGLSIGEPGTDPHRGITAERQIPPPQ
jgi:DNA-binding MarR family transcriptional regulator